MHAIREKRSGKVIHISNEPSDQRWPGKKLIQNFDEDTMEVGWTDKRYIPAYFDIDRKGNIRELDIAEAVAAGQYVLASTQKLESGKIVDKSIEELIKEGLADLTDVKTEMIEGFSRMAFAARVRILPDYKLQNAALGVYEDDRLPAYRATISAFRAEFQRLKGVVEKAKTIQKLRAITPKFPDVIISGLSTPPEDKPRLKK